MIQKSGNTIYFRGIAGLKKPGKTMPINTVSPTTFHGINISHIRSIYKPKNERGFKKIPVPSYRIGRCSTVKSIVTSMLFYALPACADPHPSQCTQPAGR